MPAERPPATTFGGRALSARSGVLKPGPSGLGDWDRLPCKAEVHSIGSRAARNPPTMHLPPSAARASGWPIGGHHSPARRVTLPQMGAACSVPSFLESTLMARPSPHW